MNRARPPLPPLLLPLLLSSLLLPLSACGSQQSALRTLGLTTEPPDEFAVTTRAPLVLPPNDTLRPPRREAGRPQELPLSTQAEAALVPEAALAGNAADSPGQVALLRAAGPPAPPGIRRRLDDETAAAGGGLTDRLMFWRGTRAGAAVDPQQESRRLREDAALGRSEKIEDPPRPKPIGNTSLFNMNFF